MRGVRHSASKEGTVSIESTPTSEVLPQLWRLALRSGRHDMEGRHTEQVDYCLSKGIAALGWEAENDGTPQDALRQIEKQHDRKGRQTVGRFINAPNQSLIWTLHTDGTYHLGEITRPWRYDDSPRAHELDSVQVREVSWADKRFDSSEVPGGVIRRFSQRGSAFSRIHDAAAARYSRQVFDKLAGRPRVLRRPNVEEVLTSLLDPWDVEDRIAIYLQASRGLLVFPASRQTSTSAYEYVLMDPKSGRHVIVQVKTGESSVDVARLASAARGDERTAIAFSTTGRYDGEDDAVEKLSGKEILSFLGKQRTEKVSLLPPRVRLWLDLASD